MGELPKGHAIHADHQLDVYLGNMVANRHCEIDRSYESDGYVVLECGCPQRHLQTIELSPAVPDGYSQRRIAEIENAFTCC